MTDETTESPAGETLADESGAEPAPATTAAVEPAGAHEGVPFWQRPNVERYLLPLVTPIVVVLAIVIFVLNLSRVFLSAHGHIPVVAGSIITVVILVGATLISNARHMRSHSAILMTCGFVLIAISAGWLVLGHSEVKQEGGTAVAKDGPCIGTLDFTALPSLKFTPASVEAKTGIYCITLTDQAAQHHTLDFDDPATLFLGLEVTQAGQKVTARAFFGTAGDFTYYCAITGHRAAGMEGVAHVTGDTMTVQEAEVAAAAAAGGPGPTGASGASGASGSSGSGG
jgi:plastocyanin